MENFNYYPNSSVNSCQAGMALSFPFLSLFSSLQVSYKSTTGHLTGWHNLWNKLLKEPEIPDIAEVIDTCIKVLLLLVSHELIQQAKGEQNG